MERRPDSETVLSREELAEYARRLSMLSVPGVEQIYRSAHNCRLDGNRLPAPAAVQQIVAACKVLRRSY